LIATVACLGALNLLAADRSTTLDHKEVAFIKDAAQGGEAEVEMGQLAQQKGQNSQIKELGTRLQQDHTKANQELTQLAQKENVTLPAEPTHKENRMTSKLQAKTGADFDKAFAEHVLTDHEKDIRKFQKALQDSKDPDLKAFIQKTLPVLRQHLEMARTAGAAVGVDQKALTAADRFLSDQSGQGTSGATINQSGTEHERVVTPPKSSTDTGTPRSSDVNRDK